VALIDSALVNRRHAMPWGCAARNFGRPAPRAFIDPVLAGMPKLSRPSLNAGLPSGVGGLQPEAAFAERLDHQRSRVVQAMVGPDMSIPIRRRPILRDRPFCRPSYVSSPTARMGEHPLRQHATYRVVGSQLKNIGTGGAENLTILNREFIGEAHDIGIRATRRTARRAAAPAS